MKDAIDDMRQNPSRFLKRVREIIAGAREKERHVKRLRKLGASDLEICSALGIEPNDPALVQ